MGCLGTEGCITCSCCVGSGSAKGVVRACHEDGWESSSSGVDEREGGGGVGKRGGGDAVTEDTEEDAKSQGSTVAGMEGKKARMLGG